MPNSVSVPCPAKVHLFLEAVRARRGRAPALSVLAAKIGVFDVVEAEKTPEGLDVEVVDEGGGSGGGEPVREAASAFRREFEMGAGVAIRLIRRIPPDAGLGSAASTAAGTLIALARMFRLESDRSEMARVGRLARGLGPEVPFFLKRDGLGASTGRRLAPVAAGRALPWMVLVYPGREPRTEGEGTQLRVPGREAVLTSLSHLDKLKKKLEKGRPFSEWNGLLFNRFEESAARPEVLQAKKILSRLGLAGVLMSGSGTTVFGFASSRSEGERVLNSVRGYPWRVFLTSCLG